MVMASRTLRTTDSECSSTQVGSPGRSDLVHQKSERGNPTQTRRAMEGLFTHVCSVLINNAVERWRTQGSLPTISIFFDPDVILRTKLIAWLVGEGVRPELFSSTLLSELIEEFRQVMPEANLRTATSWLYLTTTLLQGNAILGEVNGITDDIVADNYALMTYFRDLLPQAAEALGWNE